MKLVNSALLGAMMASSAIWPVSAQWQVPLNNVPIGQGSGTGFGSAAAGTNNQALMGNTGAAPGFRALTGSDLPTPAAGTLGGVKSLTCSASNWFNTLSTAGAFGCSQPSFADLTGSLASLSQMPTQVTGTVLANVSGSTAVPSAVAPQAFNQAGFTGIAPCGYAYADNAGPNFSGGAALTTQVSINQVGFIILCTGSGWGGVAWTPDPTAIKVSNIIGGVFSASHRLFDVTGQAGTGTCTATGVSDETHQGCNDVSAPCHVAGVATECTIYIVAKTTTPQTVNDVGLVGSSRGPTLGPSGTVQTAYPYYAPYFRNITTGQATFAGETLKYYLVKLGSLHTILGDTTLGFGRYANVVSGSTASLFTAISIPASMISPNAKNVEFGMSNTGAAASLCGISPYGAGAGSNWTTVQLDYPNNPGLSNLFIKTGLMGTAGNYGYVSSVAGCSGIVIAYTDSIGGTP